MAITETVRDLDLAPNITKTVVLDLQKVIPTDTEGDEIYTTSATTTATSKITGTAITPIFLREMKAGYSKSSGTANPPFTLTSANNQLQVSIDGSAFRTITLDEGIGLSGDNISDDLQVKISAVGGDGGLEEGDLGFLNVLVDFKNGRFRIISGTVSNTYTGTGKSSVRVISGAADASELLGFDIPVESEVISAKRPTETKLSTAYVGGSGVVVESVDDYEVGDAFTITDGTNREYFVIEDINVTTLVISGTGSLAFTYSGGSLVQKIFERDPDADLASPYETVDELIRFQLRSLANQILFA